MPNCTLVSLNCGPASLFTVKVVKVALNKEAMTGGGSRVTCLNLKMSRIGVLSYLAFLDNTVRINFWQERLLFVAF